MEAKSPTTREMIFPIKDFFSKCDQILRQLCIWAHLLKKSLMENFIFSTVTVIWHMTCDMEILIEIELTLALVKIRKTLKLSCN